MMDLQREGREIAEASFPLWVLDSDLWYQSAIMISISFVEYFGYIMSVGRVWDILTQADDCDTCQ